MLVATTQRCPLSAPNARRGDGSWASQRSTGSDCTSHGCLPPHWADTPQPIDTDNPNGRHLWSPRTKELQRSLPASDRTLNMQGRQLWQKLRGSLSRSVAIHDGLTPSERPIIPADLQRSNVCFRVWNGHRSRKAKCPLMTQSGHYDRWAAADFGRTGSCSTYPTY
jgi:hypothetical protein